VSAIDAVFAVLGSRYPLVERDQRLAVHQHAAVVRVLRSLEIHRGVLLADEVGLGKSWVAAAVCAKWQAGGGTCEFIVPAALVSQWKGVLARFSVKGAVSSHDALLGNRMEDPAGLIVVDEAHRFRNRETRRYRALARRALGTSMLLLTATPIANRLGDLLSILRLFAPDDILRLDGLPSLEEAFAAADRERLGRVLSELVIRRDRAVLPPALHFGDLARQGLEVPARPNRSEIDAAIGRLSFPLIGRSEFLRPMLRRRLESSEAALRATLVRQRRFYRRAMEALAEGSRVTKRDLLRIFGDDDGEVYFQDLLFKPFWFGGGESPRDLEDIGRELEIIEELLKQLSVGDSPKRDALLELLPSLPMPAIVYTAAIATARDLFTVCRERWRCAMVTSRESRMNTQRMDSERLFGAFRHGEIDLLICTDIGAEGLNLQQAASIVHYDLPWNPVRIDQRNGRAHRIGQKRDVVRSIYFLPNGPRKSDIFVAMTRKKRIRNSLLGVEGRPAVPLGAHAWDDAAINARVQAAPGWWRIGHGHEGLALAERGGSSLRRRAVRRCGRGSNESWPEIEAWITSAIQNNGTQPEPASPPAWAGAVGASLEARDRARAALPEPIAAEVRLRWASIVERSGQMNARWRELLARSYRVGVDHFLQETLAGPDPSCALEAVRRTLENERRECDLRVRIVGGLL
jgi:superfamily II DNA or RNA helicase